MFYFTLRNAIIAFICIVAVFLFSCTKNNLNPSCWGNCSNVKFYYISGGCSGLKGYLVIESERKVDTLNVVGSIPKRYQQEGADFGMEVCATYIELEDAQFDSTCVHYDRTVKIKCISKK